MAEAISDVAPTSTATTGETEPEVVAAVSSAEGSDDQPLAFRIDGPSPVQPLLLLIAAATLGFVGYRWLCGRPVA